MGPGDGSYLCIGFCFSHLRFLVPTVTEHGLTPLELGRRPRLRRVSKSFPESLLELWGGYVPEVDGRSRG